MAVRDIVARYPDRWRLIAFDTSNPTEVPDVAEYEKEKKKCESARRRR